MSDESTPWLMWVIVFVFKHKVKYLLESLDVLPISEVLAVQLDTILGEYIFIDVYKVFKSYPLQITAFGVADALNHSSELFVTGKFLKKLTRKNLQAIQLRCALAVWKT